MEVFVSSVAFADRSIEEMVSTSTSQNWSLEFSSGVPYRPGLVEIYSNSATRKMIHNYFPPPSEPFVMNLASGNPKTRQLSIDHCIKALKISKDSGAPFYAAHAGFCIDPDVNDLGKKIEYDVNYSREHHKSIFIESVREILEVANELELPFLIENNVLARFNFNQGENPFLCVDAEEISWLFNEIRDERLGLLLDTAHLKVSAQSLGLNLVDQLKGCSNWIRAIHHSDNNGERDSNERLDDSYWFLPYMKDYTDLIHVIEVKNLSDQSIQQHIQLLQSYGS